MRSQSQHYHHNRPNLIARQPLFAEDDTDVSADADQHVAPPSGNFRPSLYKQSAAAVAAQKSRLMNVPIAIRAPTSTSTLATTPSTTVTTTTVTPPTPAPAPVREDESEYEYEDEHVEEVKPTVFNRPSLLERLNDELADEVEYIRSNANQLDSSRSSVAATASTEATKTTTTATTASEAAEPVILTSNFYLPESVAKSAPSDAAANSDDEYEFEEYEDDEDYEVTPPKSTSTTARSVEIGEGEFDGDDLPSTVESKSEHEVTKESDAAAFEDDDEEVLGQAVISVVTTKSVINSSTTRPAVSTASGTESGAAFGDITEAAASTEEYASAAAPANLLTDQTNETSAVDAADTTDATLGAANSSTENYLVVASVQTSRSVSGARYLPFAQVAQEEKKQVLDMKSGEEVEDGDEEEEEYEGEGADDGGEVGDDVTYVDDAIDPTTVPTVRKTKEMAEVSFVVHLLLVLFRNVVLFY